MNICKDTVNGDEKYFNERWAKNRYEDFLKKINKKIKTGEKQ